MHHIVIETNQYAIFVNNNNKTYGGDNWEPLTTMEFKVFIAITLYMGIKRQPNVKTYWQKLVLFFHCPTIMAFMS